MRTVHLALEAVLSRTNVWVGYARALRCQVRGARIGRRVAVHSRCRIDRPWGVDLGDHVRLEHGVWLKLVDHAAQLTLGACTFIGANSEVDVQESVVIGAHSLIAPGCFITDHHHRLGEGDIRIDQMPCVARPVVIGNDVWVGAGVVVLAGVSLGDGAVVGAGSVVTRDIPPRGIAVGVPARTVRYRP